MTAPAESRKIVSIDLRPGTFRISFASGAAQRRSPHSAITSASSEISVAPFSCL